jgi:hypothetical protein
MLETSEPLLYTTLLSRVGEENELALMEADIAAFKAGSDFYTDEDNFPDNYSEFTKIAEWMDANGATAPRADWIETIEDILEDTIISYAASDAALIAEFRIWDNLIVHFFRGKAELVPALCKTLSILQIIRRIADSDGFLESNKQLRDAYTAQPLISEWLRKAFNEYALNPDGGVNETPEPEDNTEWEAALDRFNKLKKAVKEINRALELKWMKQAQALENQEIPNPEDPEYEPPIATTGESPYNLYPADITPLSEDTQDIIDESGVTNGEKTNAKYVLSFVEEQLDTARIQVVGNGKPDMDGGNSKITYTVTHDNSNIVSSQTVCDGEKIPSLPDPCSMPNPVEFPFNNRSNISSVFVGDLIVTKQQLIKYALGEVAHIENVMLGELRQREYRRFNRVEQKEEIETKTTTETVRSKG